MIDTAYQSARLNSDTESSVSTVTESPTSSPIDRLVSPRSNHTYDTLPSLVSRTSNSMPTAPRTRAFLKAGMVFSGAVVTSPRWAIIRGNGREPEGKSQRVTRSVLPPVAKFGPHSQECVHHTQGSSWVSINRSYPCEE